MASIVAAVYRDVPESMRGYAAQSVESVCAKVGLQGDARFTAGGIEPL